MHIVVFVTVPSRKSAKAIIELLLKKKLAACVNIISGVESYFWWEGKIDRAKEFLLVIKTQKKLFARLAEAVQSCHPYSVPEIISLPVTAGNKKYLEWINDSCR